MVSMQLNSWLSTQATPPVAEPTLRGLEAIAAADGWMVALVGMSIVFVALFLLFLVMVGLLYWFMRSPAKTFLSTRHEAAKREMTEATALRARELHGSDPHSRGEAETNLTHSLKSLSR